MLLKEYFEANHLQTEGGLMGINGAVFDAANLFQSGSSEDEVIAFLGENHSDALTGDERNDVLFNIVDAANQILGCFEGNVTWNGPRSFECLLVPQ